MSLSIFSMINNELLTKDPDMVLEQASIIIFHSKSSICVAKNGKDSKNARYISRRIHFVRNGEVLFAKDSVV